MGFRRAWRRLVWLETKRDRKLARVVLATIVYLAAWAAWRWLMH